MHCDWYIDDACGACTPSWWMEQFCAGNNSSAVGITTTEMTTTKAQCAQSLACGRLPPGCTWALLIQSLTWIFQAKYR